MKSLVLYDSNYGNTKQVAEAIAQQLAGATVIHVKDMHPGLLVGLTLLVVGAR